MPTIPKEYYYIGIKSSLVCNYFLVSSHACFPITLVSQSHCEYIHYYSSPTIPSHRITHKQCTRLKVLLVVETLDNKRYCNESLSIEMYGLPFQLVSMPILPKEVLLYTL